MKKTAGTMFVLLALACRPLFSQPAIEKQSREAYSRNCIYLELLGTGLLYSVNYEHRFAEHWSGRVGFTAYSIPGILLAEPEVSMDFLGFPVLLNYLAGSNGHYFEIGAGVLVLNLSLNGRKIWSGMDVNGQLTTVSGAAAIGYRYQPTNGGFLFRIGLTPWFHHGGSKILGGLSLGVAF